MANGLLSGLIGTPGINPNAPDPRQSGGGLLEAFGMDNTPQNLLGNFLLDLSGSLSNLGGPLGQQAASFQANRRDASFRNALIRESILDARRRREGISGLTDLLVQTTQVPPSLLGEISQASPAAAITPTQPATDLVRPGGEVPTISTPEGQSQALGLLGQFAPDQVAQGVLGQMFPQQRSEPSLLRNIRALEDPTLSEDQRSLLRKNLEADPAVTDQQLKEMDLRLKMIKMEQEAAELREGTKTRQQDRAGLISGIARDIKDATRLSEINDELRNTLGEAGIPFADARRAVASGIAAVQDLFGFDSSQAKRVMNLMNEFNKGAARLAAKTATRLFDEGNITNFQFQTIAQATPSLSIGADANDRVIADTLEILLDGADNAQIPVKGREDIEKMIQRLRNTGNRIEDLPGFDDLSRAEQDELRRRLNSGN